VLWMVALTNAYNFMDGIDGIAGIQAIVAGLGWVVIGAIAGLADAVVLGLLLTAGVAGFLVYNWPPARVFMGDAGSGFLGFSFAAIPLIAPEHGPHLLLSAALLTWPFLFDTSFTLIRRVRRRENIFAAHRTHLYQRLTVTGLSHARVTALYGVLGVLGAGGAIALATAPPGVALLPAVVVPVSAFALWRYVVSREFLSSREPSLPAALPR
jgi:UDP-N-acetylmuramyl pentapeptide phosphotransferase/UDP-N-acetylglucosamine-1-phosphate transferase